MVRVAKGVPAQQPQTPKATADFGRLRSEVRERVTQPGDKLPCFRPQKAELIMTIERFSESLQGTSLVVYGPRGAGKTTLIQSALDSVSPTKANFVVARLNGLAQLDDREAVRELATQLSASVDLDNSRASYSELLARILNTGPNVGVVVVLEEAQLFAAHHNQGLLYSLLDATQLPETPLLLLLSSPTPAFPEALEKRVRSRLSTTRLLLCTPDWERGAFLDWARQLLRTGDAAWDAPMGRLLDAADVADLIRRLFDVNPSPGFLRHFLRLVTEVGEGEPTREDFYAAQTELFPNAQKEAMEELSTVELTLLLAVRGVQRSSEEARVNFEATFDEYRRFANRNGLSILPKQRPLLMKAYEKLMAQGLIARAPGATDGQKAHTGCVLEVRGSELSEVACRPELPAPVRHWAAELSKFPDPHL